MKILFTLLTFSLITAFTAQDGSWKIMLNGQTKLQTATEDEAKNVIHIDRGSLNRTGALIVIYDKKPLQKGWTRVITVSDSEGELSRHPGNTYRIMNPALRSMLGADSVLKIYSFATPIDPKQAANIRIRRVHLCTLVFK